MQKLTLAYSPCPNDTFIFYHLAHGNTDFKIPVRQHFDDVETLNQAAFEGKFDITKLSYAALFQVMDKYEILNSGSALGKGNGPILLKRKGEIVKHPKGSRILVPGKLTTANLLLGMHLEGDYEPEYTRFDKILEGIHQGKADFGLVIHEERFTYEKQGFEKVIDLGEWWEETTGLPIPLGGIGVLRNLEPDTRKEIDQAIQQSLDLAYKRRDEIYDYILSHSQSPDRRVADSHIELYVNAFTRNLGEDGRRAIEFLYNRSSELGLIHKQRTEDSIFRD